MNPPEDAHSLPEEESGWKPGDPINREPTDFGYTRRPFFNFREDLNRSQECSCPDSARWPNPKTGQEIRGSDELERFIAAERLAREESA